MFDHMVTRDGDIPARRPYDEDRRTGLRRHRSPDFRSRPDRRGRHDRRLDADWRFAVIRRWMGSALMAAPG